MDINKITWSDADSFDVKTEEGTIRVFKTQQDRFTVYEFDDDFEVVGKSFRLGWQEVVEYINWKGGDV